MLNINNTTENQVSVYISEKTFSFPLLFYIFLGFPILGLSQYLSEGTQGGAVLQVYRQSG